MKYGLFVFLILALSSCDNDDNGFLAGPADLAGKWVEVKDMADTVAFESWDGMEIMNLRRGNEIKNGFELPKSGSGPYEYKLVGEKISLYWMLSSNYSFKDYNFSFSGDSLKIDNFYNSPLGPTLTFRRVR